MKQIAIALFTLFVVTSLIHAEPDVHIGLGVWIWELPRCERGNVEAIVGRAKEARLGHVLIRVTENGDGWASFNDRAKVTLLASRLRSEGITVLAWGYHYPYKIESQIALVQSVLDMAVFDGYVLNVETEFRNCRTKAEELFAPIRRYRDANYPDKLLGYSTFGRIDRGLGAEMPIEVFGQYTDVAMPQAYWRDFDWEPRTTAYRMCQTWATREQQWKSEGEAASIKPLIPTAHAYDGTGGTEVIPASELEAFLDATKGYFGVNVWSWQHMAPEHWKALVAFGNRPAEEETEKPTRTLWKTVLLRWALGIPFALLLLLGFSQVKDGNKSWGDSLITAVIWPLFVLSGIVVIVIAVIQAIRNR